MDEQKEKIKKEEGIVDHLGRHPEDFIQIDQNDSIEDSCLGTVLVSNIEEDKYMEDLYSDSNKEQEKEITIENVKVCKKQKIKEITKNGIIIALVIGVCATSIAALKGCNNSNKQQGTAIKIVVEDASLDELLNSLEEGHQQEMFKTMNEVQKTFNNNAAESIYLAEDEDVKLYLTSEEIIALFTYANVDLYSKETFRDVFANSNLINLEKNTNDYLTASKVLCEYYRYATTQSGLSELFQSESEKAYYEEIENLVLEYNKTKSAESKNAIKARLQEVYISGQIDDEKSKYPGATSFIGTFVVPSLYINGALSKEEYENYININEVVTCDYLKEQIKDAEEACNTSFKDTTLLLRVVQKMNDENVKSTNRELTAKRAEVAASRLNSNKNSSNSNSSTKKGTTKKTEIGSGEEGRSAAVQEFGESAVQKAEQEAESKFHEQYDEENAKQKEYANGISDGYAITYRTTVTRLYQGQTVSFDEFAELIANKAASYTGKYKDSYIQGLKEGAQKGYRQAISEYQEYLDSLEQGNVRG